MDNLQLTSTVLNLKQRLSKDDRERLDLYLKRDVPRRAGDDLALNGNLKIIQSYLDKDKINEKGFNLLIDAFRQIQCSDAINILKEHQQRMISSGTKESTQGLASIMPSNTEACAQNGAEDTYVTMDAMDKQVDYYAALNSDHMLINEKKSFTMEIEEEKKRPRKPCSCAPLLKRKCLIISTIFVTLFLISVALNIVFINKKRTTEGSLLIKAGQKFGGDGGESFDDSLLPNFTYFHYLTGFTYYGHLGYNGCEFHYNSSHDNTQVNSGIRGNNGNTTDSRSTSYLNIISDRIKKVNVVSYRVQITEKSKTEKLIMGLQFVTVKNEIFPQNSSLKGYQILSEEFPGYTLGYVTGKSDKQINQLQFFWYKTEQTPK